MASPPVVRCLAERGCAPVAAGLFPRAELVLLDRAELCPEVPFEGPLFRALEAAADLGGGPAPADAGRVAALFVPCEWRGSAPAPGVAPVADHVNLARRGPLTGAWPASVPRTFPCMTGIYQPALVRSRAAASLYSDDVVVAGVGDAALLAAFERRVLDEGDYLALSDCLVPAAIVAAYYHVNLAAGVVPAGERTQARTP